MINQAAGRNRVLPPVYFLLALILMLSLHIVSPGLQLIGSPVRFGGLLLVAAGIALVLWPAGLFRRAGTTIKPFQESTTLVVGGGSATMPGVCEILAEQIQRPGFPVQIGRVQAATSPYTVAQGCLIHAEVESEPQAQRRAA